MGNTSAANQLTTGDRRRSQRSGYIIEGQLTPHNSSQRREVTTFDLSLHGVGFDAAFPVAVGEQHIHEMGSGDQSLVCDLRVVNCRAAENDVWHVGAEFI